MEENNLSDSATDEIMEIMDDIFGGYEYSDS